MLTLQENTFDEQPVIAVTASSPIVQARNLTVEFPIFGTDRTATAISKFDLSIARGEIFGLVGESGAGKTVLARTLLGSPPEPGKVAEGDVVFDGENLLAFDSARLQDIRGARLSLIAANPRGELNPLKTVGQQVSQMARVHLKLSRDEARKAALDMLAAVQIPDPVRRYDAYPHELSGGMAQRVVIAIALICFPDFIVADDATSGLDVTVQTQVLDLIRKLARDRNSSLLFITRDMGIPAHYCDRIGVMFRGELVEVAPREEFYLRPRHPYTIYLMAAFLHNPALRDAWSRPSAFSHEAIAGKGCQYAARCPLATEICLREHPKLTMHDNRHQVSCHNMVSR